MMILDTEADNPGEFAVELRDQYPELFRAVGLKYVATLTSAAIAENGNGTGDKSAQTDLAKTLGNSIRAVQEDSAIDLKRLFTQPPSKPKRQEAVAQRKAFKEHLRGLGT